MIYTEKYINFCINNDIRLIKLKLMNRKLSSNAQLLAIIFTVSTFTLSARLQAANPVSAQPNVIVIIADDLGYADLAFLPNASKDVKKYGTPGFDKLAQTGVYFSNAYGTAAVCSPSRTGLITGQYQERWGNYHFNEGGLPQNIPTIPEVLRKEGYMTAKYGKTHLNGGPKEFPTLHGFDEYLGFMFHTWDYIRLNQKDEDAYRAREGFDPKNGFANGFDCQIVGPLLKATGAGKTQKDAEKVSYENGFTTDIFTNEACNFIKRDKGNKPFYLQVAYNAVHHPTYVVNEKWAKMTGARYVPWDRDAEKWGFPYWEPNEETNKEFHQKWGHMNEIDVEGRRCYLSQLLALDHGVLQILAALEETGQRENTLIIFVSDNGGTINTYSNNQPLNGWKYMLAEGGIRIPMLVSMPGKLPEGKTEKKAIVSTLDIFPTILELAGVKHEGKLDGTSLLPLLSGKAKTQHETLIWAIKRDVWVIRHGKWKLTNNAGWEHRAFSVLDNGDVVNNPNAYVYSNKPQLFNLEKDVAETTNLIEKYPETAKQLRQLYEEWDKQMPGPCRPDGTPKK